MMFRPFFVVLPALMLALTSCQIAYTPRIESGKKPLTAEERDDLSALGLSAGLESLEKAMVRGGDADGYNAAVEKVLSGLQRAMPVNDWRKPSRVRDGKRSWRLEFEPIAATAPTNPDEWAPGSFHKLMVASAIPTSDFEKKNEPGGWGVPVILVNEGHGKIVKERSFRPEMPSFTAATAIFEKGGDGVRRLRLINPFRQQKVKLLGRTRPMASNVTALVEMTLDNPYIKQTAQMGLFRPEAALERTGLFSIAPYDASKRPLVFVHGLRSSPTIWKFVINEILADPKLNESFQPVVYFYPTGLGVPAAAADLRSNMKSYRDQWDPKHSNAGMNSMVMVGHSMGGLLTQMQVIDSGEELQKAFFSVPVDELGVGRKQREQAREVLVFERQPYIRRVIFIAVPHQGSELADNPLMRQIGNLIRAPQRAMGMANLALLKDRGLLNPKLREYKLMGMRSVETLSPKHPYFKVLKEREIGVPWHSIIGDRGRGDSPHSSDGVVPYASSHFDEAETEDIVPQPHSCVEASETVTALLTILRKHAAD